MSNNTYSVLDLKARIDRNGVFYFLRWTKPNEWRLTVWDGGCTYPDKESTGMEITLECDTLKHIKKQLEAWLDGYDREQMFEKLRNEGADTYSAFNRADTLESRVSYLIQTVQAMLTPGTRYRVVQRLTITQTVEIDAPADWTEEKTRSRFSKWYQGMLPGSRIVSQESNHDVQLVSFEEA